MRSQNGIPFVIKLRPHYEVRLRALQCVCESNTRPDGHQDEQIDCGYEQAFHAELLLSQQVDPTVTRRL